MLSLIKKNLVTIVCVVVLYFLFNGFIQKKLFSSSNHSVASQDWQGLAATRKIHTQKRTQKLIQAQARNKNLTSTHNTKNLTKQENAKPIRNFLKKESYLVGQLTNNPKKILKRLRQRAKLLNVKNFNYLFKTSLNTDLSGDRRFLSVHLISLSGQAKALSYLEKIIAQPIKKTEQHTGLYEQELVIKMQAIEGFINLVKTKKMDQKKIHNLLARQDNPFLAKFIRNSMKR